MIKFDNVCKTVMEMIRMDINSLSDSDTIPLVHKNYKVTNKTCTQSAECWLLSAVSDRYACCQHMEVILPKFTYPCILRSQKRNYLTKQNKRPTIDDTRITQIMLFVINKLWHNDNWRQRTRSGPSVSLWLLIIPYIRSSCNDVYFSHLFVGLVVKHLHFMSR